MATDDVSIIVLKGIIHGVLWGLFYYFVRKSWNSANFGIERQRIEERQEAGMGSPRDFYGDAIFGGIASVFVYSLDKIAYRLLGL